jgi:FlaA1/EpsC-like NDP-sugar epimerase
MHTANTSLFRWLTLLVMLALLVVVVLDVDGWGTFLLNVAFTLFVQISMALILLGCLMVVVDIVKGALNFTSLSQYIQLGIFLASVIAVLPLIGIVFHRPVDIYDIAQTVLVIVGGLLFVPLKRFFMRLTIDQTPQPPV